MIRGTTPTHTITFSIDMQDVKDFTISYSQSGRLVLKKHMKDCNIADGKIEVTLSQHETLKFRQDILVEVQAKVITENGTVLASDIHKTYVHRIIDEEVMVW